jgi:hypothetical protein
MRQLKLEPSEDENARTLFPFWTAVPVVGPVGNETLNPRPDLSRHEVTADPVVVRVLMSAASNQSEHPGSILDGLKDDVRDGGNRR